MGYARVIGMQHAVVVITIITIITTTTTAIIIITIITTTIINITAPQLGSHSRLNRDVAAAFLTEHLLGDGLVQL